MAIYANPPKDGDFVRILAPQGLQAAVCCDVVDRGLQEQEWQGKVKMVPKVSVHFLLAKLIPSTWTHPHTQEVVEVPGELAGRPYGVNRWFTNSLAETASLRQFLMAWRGRDFTDAELKKFDLEKLIGAPAGLNIIHKRAEDGSRWYANIQGALQLPEGWVAPLIPENHVRLKDRPPREGDAPKATPAAPPESPNTYGRGPESDWSGEPTPEEPGLDDGLPF